MRKMWLVLPLLAVSCAPLRAQLNTSAQSLPDHAPLATGQVWNVKATGLAISGQTTVKVDKLYRSTSGMYVNMDAESYYAAQKSKGEPMVTFQRVQGELHFIWNATGTTLDCTVVGVDPNAKRLTGRVYVGDQAVGDCTAELQ